MSDENTENSGTDAGAVTGNPPSPEPAIPPPLADSPIEREEAPAPVVTEGEETPEKQEAAIYQPNFKYKVKDKELEFDEFVRGAIKDKDSEEKLRKIYTSASGVDELRTQRDEVVSRYQTVQGELTKVAKSIEKGDMDSALAILGIPPEKVFEWVSEKIKYENLPKEQQQAYDREREAVAARERLEERNGSFENQLQDIKAHARGLELDVALNGENIREVANAYDARIGKAGAFREKVALYGASVFAASGKDVSAIEAASHVANEWKPFLTGPSGNGGDASPTAGKPTIIERNASPIIPAIGRGGATGKQTFNSVDDLKKRYRELTAQNNGG